MSLDLTVRKRKCHRSKRNVKQKNVPCSITWSYSAFLMDLFAFFWMGGVIVCFFISAVLNLPARIPGIIDGCPRMIDQNVLGVSITRGRVGCPGELCRTVSAFKSDLSGFFSTCTWWKVDPFPRTTNSLTVVNLTQHGKMPFWPSYR